MRESSRRFILGVSLSLSLSFLFRFGSGRFVSGVSAKRRVRDPRRGAGGRVASPGRVGDDGIDDDGIDDGRSARAGVERDRRRRRRDDDAMTMR